MSHPTTTRTARVRRRTLAPLALAAMLAASMSTAAAAEPDPADCEVESTGLAVSEGSEGTSSFVRGETITIESLTATYTEDNGCAVPDDHRFVIDGTGPEGVGPAGEEVAKALFGAAGLDAIVAADQLGRMSVEANVDDEDVFTSLNDLELTVEDDAPLGEYTLRFFLVTVSNGTFTTVGFDGNPLEFTFSIVEPSPEPEPEPSAPAAASPVEQPAGGAQFVDASGTPITPTISVEDGVSTSTAGGFSVATEGDQGATEASGPIAAPSGTFTTTVDGDVPDGAVVEVWMFSEPRLVAAGESDGSGTLSIVVPTGAPLDGGDPIPAGTHTMQLLIPTADGLVAMNVGVTVGGPVPTVVPAGEGPAPIGTFVLVALLAVGMTVLGGRQVLQPTSR